MQKSQGKSRFGWLAGFLLLGIGAAMAVTNPDQATYNQYAARELSRYLQEQECSKIEASVADLCKMLDQQQGQALLNRLVADNTRRQNYGLLSIYTTDFSTDRIIPDFLKNLLSVPTISYQFETVGLLGQLKTYKAERQ